MISLRHFTVLCVLVLQGCTSMEALVSVPTKADSARIQPYQTNLHQRSIHTFDAVDLSTKLVEQNIKPRVKNLLVLVDQTDQMSSQYRGIELSQYTQEITRRFLRTVPKDVFAGGLFVLDNRATSVAEPNLDRFELQSALDALVAPQYLTPIGTADLAVAVDNLSQKIAASESPSAIVLVTSWAQINPQVAEAVMRLRQHQQFRSGFSVQDQIKPWGSRNDDGVCVYVLGVGNRMSRTVLDEADTCGFSAAADKVAQPRDMAHFVERALYLDPADSDGDGVYDYLDKCPGTVGDRIVGYDGCDRFAGLVGEHYK